MTPQSAMLVAAALKDRARNARPFLKGGALLLLAAGLGVAGYFGVQRAKIMRWVGKMDQNDVQIAAYYVTLVGPEKLIEKFKKALLQKLKYASPAIGIGIDLVTGIWDKINGGDGSKLYQACEVGVDRCDSWDAVQEAYNGLTATRQLHTDLAKKLTADEFRKLMQRVSDKKGRVAVTTTAISTGRAALIAKLYEVMAKQPAEKVITLGTGTGFNYSVWKMAGYDNPTKGYAEPGRNPDKFKKGDLIGNPTNKLVKLRSGQVLMQVATPKGPRWFKPESLTIYTKK